MSDKIIFEVCEQILNRLRIEPVKDDLLVPAMLFLTRGYEDIQAINLKWQFVPEENPKKYFIHALTQLNNTELFRGDFSRLLATIPAISDIFFYWSASQLKELDDRGYVIDDETFYAIIHKADEAHRGFYPTSPIVATQIAGILEKHLMGIPADSNTSLLDLGAGTGIIISTIFKAITQYKWDFSAVEIMPEIAALGKMHLLLAGVQPTQLNFRTEDASTSLLLYKEFDFVVSHMPVGILPPRSVSISDDNAFGRYYEISFFLRSIRNLKEGGIGILVIPDKFLFADENQVEAIRRQWVQNDYVEAVISFREESKRLNRNIKYSIVVINKNKSSELKGKIRFVKINTGIQLQLFERLQDKTEQKVVDLENVAINKFSLRAEHYFLPDLTDKHRPLGEVADLYRGPHLHSVQKVSGNSGSMPVIYPKNLVSEVGVLQINPDTIDRFIDAPVNIDSSKLIRKGDVLILCRGGRFKPTLYNLPYPAVCHPDIVIVRAKPDKIQPEYLISQLGSDLARMYADAYRSSLGGLTYIGFADLHSIPIECIPLEQQTVNIKEFLSGKLLEGQLSHQQALQTEVHEVSKRLQHTLGNSLQVIKADLRSLIRFFEAEQYNPVTNPKARPEVAEKSRLMTIFQRMLKETDDAEKSIRLAHDWSIITEGKLNRRTASLKDFFERESEKGYWTDYCVVEVSGSDIIFSFDHHWMKILLFNFFENAIKYGDFRNRPKKENLIQIEIFKEDVLIDNGDINDFDPINRENIVIIIRNNGLPFRPGFNTAFFVTDGKTTQGTGYGGALINQIVKAHGGTISVIPPEMVELSSFKVQFQIDLPIIL